MKPFVHPAAVYPYREWSVDEEVYYEENNQSSESVFALGNGYIGLRGNLEEGYHGRSGSSVTGNYLNGFFDSEPIVYPEGAYGYPSRNQAMLNVTDAKIIELSIEGCTFQLNSGRVHRYERKLDMRTGMLHRQVEWESPAGHRVAIHIRRMVPFQHKHLAVIDYEVKALNFSGILTFTSSIDGKIQAPEASDDPRLGSGGKEPCLLLEDTDHEVEQSFLWMKQRTRHTRFALLTGVSHTLTSTSGYERKVQLEDQKLSMEFKVPVATGESVTLTKYISYHTSKDVQESELFGRCVNVLRLAEHSGYEVLASEQRNYLDEFWAHNDVEIQGDLALLQGIRFNAFQLLQSVGRDGVTNIGAKGLTGEGYEGHYFWDTEMYILPFFTFTQPEISRKLLEFRYATLDKARERAAAMSQKGALYPWRTIDGSECSSYFPAGTAQMHINADISYAIKQYVQATRDYEFLATMGAEILFETSRFWVDLGHFNPARKGAFCIDGVTGPDEYTAIVNNNAYTNLMVQDQLHYAYETAELLCRKYPEHYERLKSKLGLTESELKDWLEAAEKMFIPFDEGLGIYAQDDSFLNKQRWDFDHTPADKYPLLLHYHPLVIYRHQVLKQADLVMAMFLLGDQFSLADKIRNYNYYEPLTTHDSSLSPCIHSIICAEIGDMAGAYAYFERTVRMDLDDINRNVKDGLHTAAMAGSWSSIVNGFGGLRLRGGMLSFYPRLPAKWDSYRFKITTNGCLLDIYVSNKEVIYTLLEGEEIEILHKGALMQVSTAEPRCVSNERQLEAVIFELDGVITDSGEYHYQAWRDLADELAVSFDRGKHERLKGLTRMESLEIILEGTGLNLSQPVKGMLCNKKNEKYKQLIQQITPEQLFPGVHDLLSDLQKKGVAIGLASANDNAQFILERLNIAHWFQAIADTGDIRISKPDPEIYLQVAEMLGVSPNCCVGIEDTKVGITAIKAAGMSAVGVGATEMQEIADVWLPDTSVLSVERLLGLFD